MNKNKKIGISILLVAFIIGSVMVYLYFFKAEEKEAIKKENVTNEKSLEVIEDNLTKEDVKEIDEHGHEEITDKKAREVLSLNISITSNMKSHIKNFDKFKKDLEDFLIAEDMWSNGHNIQIIDSILIDYMEGNIIIDGEFDDPLRTKLSIKINNNTLDTVITPIR